MSRKSSISELESENFRAGYITQNFQSGLLTPWAKPRVRNAKYYIRTRLQGPKDLDKDLGLLPGPKERKIRNKEKKNDRDPHLTPSVLEPYLNDPHIETRFRGQLFSDIPCRLLVWFEGCFQDVQLFWFDRCSGPPSFPRGRTNLQETNDVSVWWLTVRVRLTQSYWVFECCQIACTNVWQPVSLKQSSPRSCQIVDCDRPNDRYLPIGIISQNLNHLSSLFRWTERILHMDYKMLYFIRQGNRYRSGYICRTINAVSSATTRGQFLVTDCTKCSPLVRT